MGNEEIEKELERKYTELQNIGQQMKQMQRQIMLLNNQLMELTSLHQSLNDFKDIKEGTNIMITLGNGIYANAELKDSKDLLVNIGAGVVVKKDVASTGLLVHQQAEEIKQVHEQMMAELKGLYEQANSMEEEMNKLAKNIK